jgi:hypothetical protein
MCWQCGIPAGAPLYPVAKMRPLRDATAPTLFREQVPLMAIVIAMVMRVSSIDGLVISTPKACDQRTRVRYRSSSLPTQPNQPSHHRSEVDVQLERQYSTTCR